MTSLISKIRITVLLIAILIVFIFTACVTPPPPTPTPRPKQEPTATSTKEKLKVHFIDTGTHGDSVLIDLGKTEILIDGCLPNSGVAEYIKDYVDGSLDMMIATHPHSDHIGGLIEVLETFDVEEVWLNGDTVPRSHRRLFRLTQRFISLVNAEGAGSHEAKRGQTIDVEILTFHVLHPDILLPYNRSQRIPSILHTGNINSMVLRLRYGNIVFLFAGDAQEETENSILKAGLDVHADILKVGHHGSKNASSRKFLRSVKPKVAVYMATGKTDASSGPGSPEKPHPWTLTALKKAGAEVYGTNTHGTVIITTDGETYTIDTEK